MTTVNPETLETPQMLNAQNAQNAHRGRHPLAECAHLGVVAGEGELPLHLIKTALAWGLTVSAYTPDKSVLRPLQELLGREQVHMVGFGTLEKNYSLFKRHGIDALVAAGKVNKWVLLRNPKLDKRALALLNAVRTRTDDNVMRTLINDVESEGFRVLPQRIFMEDLFIAPGLYTTRQPNDSEQQDIDFAMATAREMARLDIGQSAAISNGMVISVEAIEGTDQMILRSKQWINKRGGVLAKVEKPDQDNRFDIPTVGPRTLKAMKKAGLHIMAIEANKTLVLELDTVIRLANKWSMIVIAV